MEKVWDELKKIEAQAEQIRTDAVDKAKNITTVAQRNAETLLSNSQTYAQDESQRLYKQAVEEANKKREEQLKANEGNTKKLRAQAEKHVDAAVSAVVNAVIKEAKI